MDAVKRCFKCGVEQPLDSFYKHPKMSDGHLGKCKECAKFDVRENRAANSDYYRQYDNRRAMAPHRVLARKLYLQSEAGKQAMLRAHKLSDARKPERKKASATVRHALVANRITKQPCFVCGNETAQAHHPDYSRPLDVIWLCVKHHRETHKMVA